ncbi:DNA helicase, partial [Tanacetum coccineum]
MHHFGVLDESILNPEIVEGLIHVLDEHNGLVRLFRTARDIYNACDILSFKIRLYNMGGVRGYELSTADVLGAIVFENGPKSRTDFDLHPQRKEFGLILKGGRLFQQYVVVVFCAIEQSRLDFIRKNQNDLRSDFLSGLYDAVSRGEREGISAGSKIMLLNTFTRGPRVFEQKVKDFLRFLKEVKTFAYIFAVLYTIEFQKRGLPHCHTLLWIESRNTLKDAAHIDEYISAKIPDPVQDPRGYKLVTELMMHGPCGSVKLDASCMQNGPCNKHFPKQYNEQTYFDSNGHIQYRRRDTGIHVMKGESRLDNYNVVLYNRALCLELEAHINVEYFGWSMIIKYLFKYISKRPDRILAKISYSETSTSTVGTSKQINEIQNYVDGHFICPFEACWRIFDFPIHCREPAVQILNVHLEDMQCINFRKMDRLDIIVNIPEKKKTTLTKWTKKSLGRLTYVHPSSGNLFYFRMLLCYQKGCKSPDEVRTVNGQMLPTFRAACEALGLLGDDKEWDIALEESTASATSKEIRFLFAQILIYCDVADPLEKILNGFGKSVTDFGLQSPPRHLLKDLQNKLLMKEKNYKRDLLKQDAAQSIPKLNRDQKNIYDLIIGGTGKTFLWKTIISPLRSEGKIVLAVASSGIASLLLPVGRTTHSRFKLPLELTDESFCHAKKKSQLGNLLVETDLIIWDEAPMNDKYWGDFRQTLPVKKGAGKEELIVAFIAESYLWCHFRICTLKENMRLQRFGLTSEERKRSKTFAKWLLDVGDGKIGEPEEKDQDNSWITIPPEYSVDNDETSLSKLINFIYDDTTLKTPTAGSLQEKAIVCPKNATADDVNAKILSNIEGQRKIYLSNDKAIPMDSITSETELLYPTKYLNTIIFPGFPPHELELKVGSPIMLLRNVNLSGGL